MRQFFTTRLFNKSYLAANWRQESLQTNYGLIIKQVWESTEMSNFSLTPQAPQPPGRMWRLRAYMISALTATRVWQNLVFPTATAIVCISSARGHFRSVILHVSSASERHERALTAPLDVHWLHFIYTREICACDINTLWWGPVLIFGVILLFC